MINGLVHRPIGGAAPAIEPRACRTGARARASASTPRPRQRVRLRPVLAPLRRAGVAPASHTPGMGWGSRRSISSYMYNHIGSFGASMEALCSSLFLGGVTRRFPRARVRPARGRRRLGVPALRRPGRPLGEAQPRRDPAPRPGAHRHRRSLLRALRAVRRRALPRGPRRASRESFTRLEPEPPVARRVGGLRHRARGGHPRALRAALLLRLRGRRPDGGLGVRRARPNPLGREAARHVQLRPRPLGRARHDRDPARGLRAGGGRPARATRDFRDFVFANPVRFYTQRQPGLLPRHAHRGRGRARWSRRSDG